MMNRIPVGLEVGIRFVVRVAVVAALVAVVSLAVILVAPKIVGGQSLSVLSGSMAPTVDTGDMVAIVPQKAEDIKIGQIVAFNDPNGSGDLYQHRVQYVGTSGNTIQVVTKGDANTAGERWQTTEGSTVGKVVLVAPKVGFLIGTLTGGKPIGIAGRDVPLGTALIILALFLAAIVVIIGILRNSDDADEAQLQEDLTDSVSGPGAPQTAGHGAPVASRPIHNQEVPPHA